MRRAAIAYRGSSVPARHRCGLSAGRAAYVPLLGGGPGIPAPPSVIALPAPVSWTGPRIKKIRRILNAREDMARAYVRSLEGRNIPHLLVASKSFH